MIILWTWKIDIKIVELISQVKDDGNVIYKELGARHDESIYDESLAIEFHERNIHYEVEWNMEIFYKGIKVGI